MVISHHIATALASERQRDLRASYRRGWRLRLPFGRSAVELEPVPPAAPAAGGDGPPPTAPALRPLARATAPHGGIVARRVGARRRERAGV